MQRNATTLKSVYNSQAQPLHPKVDDTTAEDVAQLEINGDVWYTVVPVPAQ
jgi:hypothetical protein